MKKNTNELHTILCTNRKEVASTRLELGWIPAPTSVVIHGLRRIKSSLLTTLLFKQQMEAPAYICGLCWSRDTKNFSQCAEVLLIIIRPACYWITFRDELSHDGRTWFRSRNGFGECVICSAWIRFCSGKLSFSKAVFSRRPWFQS